MLSGYQGDNIDKYEKTVGYNLKTHRFKILISMKLYRAAENLWRLHWLNVLHLKIYMIHDNTI